LEGEVHWSGNVNVTNYFIQLIATDFNGNQTILDQIDQGNVANALSSRTIYVPPMAIQAKIMNQTAGGRTIQSLRHPQTKPLEGGA